jgi:tRNA/tmRNA/rRNA uracil-C5-methylase (TrmA/RlmC/RlmD family)
VNEPADVPQVVRIERPATGGGVGHLADGRVVFVRHALVGELVEVDVTERATSFARGDAVDVLEASDQRVAAPCPYAHPKGCGGCDLQHASATAQSSWKASLVAEQLRRVAGVEWDVEVLAAPSPAKGSRTRLRCAVTDDGRLALRASRSHDLVVIDACWIADPRFAPAFAANWGGSVEVELRALGDGPAFAVARRPHAAGDVVEVRSLDGRALDPSTDSRVSVAGHTFSISPRSFWQSHRDAASMLSDRVIEWARVGPGDHVVDLFSGVGLFAIPLAKAVGPTGRVTAVESSAYAVRDARRNADGLAQVRVREWMVTPRAVNDTVARGDVVVLDPPRAGLAKGVATAIARRQPRRLVYVSCDAATFARDLKVLSGGGYRLSDLVVFDFFPMTEHVELVGLLDIAAERVDSESEGGTPRLQ